ncbi:MAG TPA: di-heme enzyme [Bryobacteraceae bacterium]|nr:di-heme enzyme [Bryobacteraceae bacterium]
MRRLRSFRTAALLLFACVLVRNAALNAQAPVEVYDWHLPKGFPKPRLPADNPMTPAKVELGRHLFYDSRLSVNSKASCATCHKQELAFTDGHPLGIGATGEKHPRGAMGLVNVAYSATLTWNNPGMKELEQQALVPMYGEHPVELGLREGDGLLGRLNSDPKYRELFERAFPESADRITVANVTKAIACFERSIISARSPWDRYHYERDESAISDAAKRGEILFFSQPLSCFRCHGGFNFSSATVSDGHEPQGSDFHNTGLYNMPGETSYPAPNVGIFEFTRNPKDVGKFKAPTLRNIALTAPYMHDGSIATLEDVIEHYAAGGRTVRSGAYAGVGRDNPNKDPLVGGSQLSDQDRSDLVEFLKSLTDRAVLRDSRFANPW